MTTPAIMLDIEALDIRPTAAIASIGAVLFEPHTDWIGNTFHIHVSLENCQRHGLTLGASTVTWWLGQDDSPRQTLINGQLYAAPLITALEALAAFIPTDAEIWCNGNSYDLPIIAHAYHACGIETPWRFYNERDLRTLKGLNKGLRIERNGTHHNALDDAVHQARLVQHILQFNSDIDA